MRQSPRRIMSHGKEAEMDKALERVLERVLEWMALLDSSLMTDEQVADMDGDIEQAERMLAKARGES